MACEYEAIRPDEARCPTRLMFFANSFPLSAIKREAVLESLQIPLGASPSRVYCSENSTEQSCSNPLLQKPIH